MLIPLLHQGSLLLGPRASLMLQLTVLLLQLALEHSVLLLSVSPFLGEERHDLFHLPFHGLEDILVLDHLGLDLSFQVTPQLIWEVPNESLVRLHADVWLRLGTEADVWLDILVENGSAGRIERVLGVRPMLPALVFIVP